MPRKIGVYRSQSNQMPGTQPFGSSTAIVRRMSTATVPIQEANSTPINVSGYTTVRGVASQGRSGGQGSGAASSHLATGTLASNQSHGIKKLVRRMTGK